MKREPAFGNKEVIDLLEGWLAEARKGELNYAAIAVCKRPNLAGCGFSGDMEKAGPALEAVEALHAKLQGWIRDRNPAVEDTVDRADYVTYNLVTASLTYDFLTWLVHEDMVRVRMGAPAPLKVHFYRGKNTNWTYANRGKLFEKVVRPALPLLGAVEESSVVGRWKPLLNMKEVVQWSREGQAVPRFTPTREAMETVQERFKEPGITITLREAPYWQHRNSNVEAWVKFATDLKGKGERVIFVRDTAKAQELMDGFETYPRASTNIQTRCALYEHSKFNLFVSNGPCALAQFGTKPFFIFPKLVEGDVFKPGSPEGFKEATGTAVGEQSPWSTPQQKLWWNDLGQDSYENISMAWESFVSNSQERSLNG